MEAYTPEPEAGWFLRRVLPCLFAGAGVFAALAYASHFVGQRQAEQIAVASVTSDALVASSDRFNTVISKTNALRSAVDVRNPAERYRGVQRVSARRKGDFNNIRWSATLASLRPVTASTTGDLKTRIVPVAAYRQESFAMAAVPKPRILPTRVRKRLAAARRRLQAERHCLAQAIYFEARSEPTIGQIAVANVVFNRVRSDIYPNTICEVVFQNYKKRNACQFSFACDGKPEIVNEEKPWRRAVRLARKMISDKGKFKPVRNATHYHAVYVRPHWSYKLKRVKKIGRHIFYWNRKKVVNAGAG